VNSLYPIDLVARRWAEALIAESRGDLAGAVAAYEEAADGYRALEARPWEAITRLGHGRSLASLGRHDEAHEALRAARAIFEDLRATPWITECDSALGVT